MALLLLFHVFTGCCTFCRKNSFQKLKVFGESAASGFVGKTEDVGTVEGDLNVQGDELILSLDKGNAALQYKKVQ